MTGTDLPSLLPLPQQPKPPAPPPLFAPGVDERIESFDSAVGRSRDAFVLENFRQALDTNPDYEANLQWLAKSAGMNPNLLRELPAEEVKKLIALHEFQTLRLAKDSPILHSKLGDPNFMFGIRDELSRMSTLEALAGSFEYGGLITERGRIGRRLLEESRQVGDPSRWPSMPELVRVERRMSGMRNFAESTGFLTGGAKFLGQMTPMLAEAGKQAIAGGFVGGLYSMAGGPLAPATVPGGILTGATTGFTARMAYEAFQVEGGNAFADMLAAHYDIGTARQAAYTVGLINAVLEMGGLASLANPFRQAVKDRVRRRVLGLGFWSRLGRAGLGTAKAIGGEIVTELAQEITNIWQEEVARQGTIEKVDSGVADVIGFDAQFDPSRFTAAETERLELPQATPEEIQARLEGIIVETFYGAGLISAFGPALQYYGDKLRVQRAERNTEILKAIATEIQASDAASRSPEMVAEFIDQLRQDGPNFYFDPREVIAALRDKDLTVDQIDRIVPGFATKITDAAAKPAVELVPISSEEFVRFNQSELAEILQPLVRVDEEGMTFQEAQELRQNEAKLEAEFDRRMENDAQKREAARQVGLSKQLELQAAGMLPSRAKYNAMAYVLGLQNVADWIGVPITQLHEARGRGLRVAGEGATLAGQDVFEQLRAMERDENLRALPDREIVDRLDAAYESGADQDVIDALEVEVAHRMMEIDDADLTSLDMPDRPVLESETSGLGIEELMRQVVYQARNQGITDPAAIGEWIRTSGDISVMTNLGVQKGVSDEELGHEAIAAVEEHESMLRGMRSRILKRKTTGTFDPNDPNILRQTGVDLTAKERAKLRISPVIPTAVEGDKDPGNIRLPMLELASEPEGGDAFKKNVALFSQDKHTVRKPNGKFVEVRAYDSIRPKGRTPEQRAESIIDQMVRNLQTLFDAVPKEVRDRSRKWYVGANRIAKAFARRYGLTLQQSSGILAVLSPQADWRMNVSYAERILDAMTGLRDKVATPEMEQWLATYAASRTSDAGQEVARRYAEELRGKALGDISDPVAMAYWIRAYDESHNVKTFRDISPEGEFLDVVQRKANKKGETGDQEMTWTSFEIMASAIRILQDGSQQSISDALGGAHKVRNFYNNILDPNTKTPFVTSDTHQVAANLLMPLGSSAAEVQHNLGTGRGSARSAALGLSGTYWVYHEAVVRAAKSRGVLPREMQSISWEAVRALFSPEFKRNKAKVEEVRNIWKAHHRGKLSYTQAVGRIFDLAGGLDEPGWFASRPGAGQSAEDGASSYDGELPASRLRSRQARGSGQRGAGARPGEAREGGPAAGVAQEPLLRADDPGTMQQLAGPSPTFYSALSREVGALNTKSSSVAGWKQALTGLVKNGKVKAEEVEWTGITDWLDLQEGKVTKEDVVAFLDSNGVRVETVQRGGRVQDRTFRVEPDGMMWRVVDQDGIVVIQGIATEDDARDSARVMQEDIGHPQDQRTKFESYTIPGGENYREVLLTLPDLAATPELDEVARVTQEALDRGEMTTQERVEAIAVARDKLPRPQRFQSAHWDEPNVVAHIRLNDRVDADGNRVLLVEEIQSDWAQKGRKLGFGKNPEVFDPNMADTMSREELIGFIADDDLLAGSYDIRSPGGEGQEWFIVSRVGPGYGEWGDVSYGSRAEAEAALARLIDPEYRTTEELRQRVREAIAEENLIANPPPEIPRAPFVESTKGWLNLALKKILMLAVEGGYDKVAFINGKQSAERYDLSQQVDRIEVFKSSESEVREIDIFVSDETGRDPTPIWVEVDQEGKVSKTDPNTTLAHRITGSPLADVVGQELAERIMQVGDGATVTLEADDLKVGGEGMVAFYDKIVPQAAEKLVKKLGGGKIGTVNIDLVDRKALEIAKRNSDYEAMGRAYPKGKPYILPQAGFAITDELRAKVAGGLPLFQRGDTGPRGLFGRTTTGDLMVVLTKKQDPSTFLHELGHYFLTLYEAILTEPVDPMADDRQGEIGRQKMRQHFQAFLDWVGVADIEAWQALPPEKRKEYHEQFAYGWERYLATGEAPTGAKQVIGLWRLFGKWIRQAYRGMVDEINSLFRREFGRDLPALTPEVRRFMDALLFDDQQVDQQLAARGLEAMFEEIPEGVSAEQWADYLEAIDVMRSDAKDALHRDSLKALAWQRRTRLRIHREIDREAAELRRQIEPEVRAAVSRERVHVARRFLRTGETETADGVMVAEAHKLDTEDVRRLLVAAERDGQVPAGTSLRANLTNLTKKGGEDPVSVYAGLGYESAQEMVADLATASSLEEAVAERVAERVKAERPELFDVGRREQRIDEAIHTEAMARMIVLEDQFMSRAARPVRLMLQAARNVARRQLAKKAMREVDVRSYTIAEGRAARAARKAFLAGKFDEAIAQKRQQLLFNQIATEAARISEMKEKALARWRKFFGSDEKMAKRRDMHLVGAGRALLLHFGLGPPTHRKTPGQYLDELKTYADDDVVANAAAEVEIALRLPRSIDAMTVPEFEDFVESVDALWELSRETKVQRDQGKKVEQDRVAEEIGDSIQTHIRPKRIRAGAEGKPTRWQKISDAVYSGIGHLRRAEHLADSWDGGPGGPLERHFIRPVKQALDTYRLALQGYVKRYVERLQGLSVSRDPIEYRKIDPETGERTGELMYVFDGTLELIGAIRHSMGNLSNKRKLLLGRKNNLGMTWAELTEDGDFDSSDWDAWIDELVQAGVLTEEHFDFVQFEYDLNEEIKPLAQAAHFRIYGRHFSELENTPTTVVFPDGTRKTYRGGYVPAKTDRALVFQGKEFDAMKAIEEDHRQAMPMKLDGFTKTRVENYTRELSLDLNLAVSHFSEALRFALVQPAVRDAARLLNRRDIREVIEARDGYARTTLLNFLQRAASQTIKKRFEVMGSEWVDDAIDGLRSWAGRSIMLGNIRNALQQPTGLFVGMTRVRAKHLSMALGQVISSMPSTLQFVRGLSKFMDYRISNQVFDLYNALDDVIQNPNRFQRKLDYINRKAYFLQAATQNVTDLVVWVGTFNQELAKMGADVTDEDAVAEAVARADTNVRLTQSSLLPEDYAQYEVGSAGYRTLTQFTNFFNMMANNLGTEIAKVVRDARGNPGRAAAKIAWIAFLGFSAPMLVADAIVRGLGGKFVDDEDDGHEDELSEWFIDAHVSGAFAMVPIIGQLALRGFNAWNDKAYDDRMMESPSIAALEQVARGAATAWDQAFGEGGEMSGREVKDIWQLIGIALGVLNRGRGVPTGQIGKTLGYAQEVETGQVRPLVGYEEADYLRGLVTGVASEGTRR